MASKSPITFIHGFIGAALFGKLRGPNAPTEPIDSCKVKECVEFSEFQETLERLTESDPVSKPRK